MRDVMTSGERLRELNVRAVVVQMDLHADSMDMPPRREIFIVICGIDRYGIDIKIGEYSRQGAQISHSVAPGTTRVGRLDQTLA